MIKIKQELEVENLFYLGVLILFGNGAISYLLGSVARYGALLIGFGIICFTAYARVRRCRISGHLILPFLGGVYCIGLLINSFIQRQSTSGGTQIIFSLVIFALFVAGYFMGRSSPVVSFRPSGGSIGLFVIVAACSSFGYSFCLRGQSWTTQESTGMNMLAWNLRVV